MEHNGSQENWVLCSYFLRNCHALVNHRRHETWSQFEGPATPISVRNYTGVSSTTKPMHIFTTTKRNIVSRHLYTNLTIKMLLRLISASEGLYNLRTAAAVILFDVLFTLIS